MRPDGGDRGPMHDRPLGLRIRDRESGYGERDAHLRLPCRSCRPRRGSSENRRRLSDLLCPFRQSVEGLGQLAVLWAGLGAALGHNWPFWRRFRGGKGVAVTCLAIFLFSPVWGLVSDIAGMLVVFITGYLPLGAVVIVVLFTVFALLFHGTQAALLALVLALIMISRHWPGLIRVLHGTEERNAQLLKRKQ